MKLPSGQVEEKEKPPLKIIYSNVADLQQDVPTNVQIELRFNQPLDPVSVEHTEFVFASGKLKKTGRKRYDLLTRTLTLVPDGRLSQNLWYKLRVTNLPLSISGSKMDQKEITLMFRTGVRVQDSPPADEVVNFEREIFPVFGYPDSIVNNPRRNCICHGQNNPMMDLRLLYERAEDFLSNVVSADSKEWRGWKIIQPAKHEKSYLLYKILGDESLGMNVLMGSRMPPPPDYEPLDAETIRKIKIWIEQGAGSGK